MNNLTVPAAFICILGNDGTGKTTMCKLVNQKTQYIGV
jgi:thymidylate kinase